MYDNTAVTLLRAIRGHSGLELAAIRDAGNHGADGGFSGFIWTTDCVEFYTANESTILEGLRDEAEEFGYANVYEFVNVFSRADMLDDPGDGFKTLCAWWALESVGRWLQDRWDNRRS